MNKSFTRAGAVPLGLSLLFGAAAGAMLLRDGLARRALAADRPAEAASLALDLPDVAARSAEAALAAGGAGRAMRLADAALAHAPLDARALRVRGLAAERLGDTAAAYATMEVAGRLGWRDVPTQLWIFARSLEGGDIATALQRGDALLRQSNSQSPLFDALAAATQAPAMRDGMVALLAGDPPWRFRFFQYATGYSPAGLSGMAMLAPAVDGGPAPLTGREAAFASGALVAAGRDVAAWRLYRTLRAGRAALRPALLQDGEFERHPPGDGDVTRSPFEWLLQTGAVEPAEIDLRPDGGGNALRLAPAAPGALLARQILLLPPGTYRLGWQARGEEGTPALRLQLACRRGGAPLLDRRFTAGGDWSRQAATVTIPPGCVSQALAFVGAGAESAAWVDGVTLGPG